MPFDGSYIDDNVAVLELARSLVAKGWCQRAYMIDRHGFAPDDYCAIGALRVAYNRLHNISAPIDASHPVNTTDAYRCLRASVPVMTRLFYDHETSVQSYNDAPWRSKNQVLRLFDKALSLHDAAAREHQYEPMPV